MRDLTIRVGYSSQREKPCPLRAHGLRRRAVAASFLCKGPLAMQGHDRI